MKTFLGLALGLVLLVSIWSAVVAMEKRADALAWADSIDIELLQARQKADALGESLALEKARAETALAHLAIQRKRADSILAVTAQKGRKSVEEALGTGATLSETLETAREASTGAVRILLGEAEGQLVEHLDADRRTVDAFQEQIRVLSEARAIEAEEKMIWKDRALLAEETLEAERVACQLCQEEIESLRAIKDPGLFQRILGQAKTVMITAGGTALVVVLVLS